MALLEPTVSVAGPSSAAGPTLATTSRPATHKARGVCKYYKDPRGCHAKDKCKFLHSEPVTESDSPALTPYDKAKVCKFFLQGYCRRGEQCWFKHTEPKDKERNEATLDEEDDVCSICFEKPVTYGLLSGCSHVFCITCINQWRDPNKKSSSTIDSGNTKRCPMCREPSRFITPTSKFWKHGTDEKGKTVEAYRQSMSRIQCRYFQKSLLRNKNKPLCPFGKECFYQHKKEDGTLYVFTESIEVAQSRYFPQNRRFRSSIGGFELFEGLNTAVDIVERLGYDMGRLAFAGHEVPSTTEMLLTTALTRAVRAHVEQHTMASLRQFQAPVPGAATSNNTNNAGGVGSGISRAGSRPHNMYNLMRVLDDITAFPPAAPPGAGPNPTETRTRGNIADPNQGSAERRSQRTTRHSTVLIADGDIDGEGVGAGDDRPPRLVPDSDRPTSENVDYNSDDSMPPLREVANSSDDGDSDGDDDWTDENEAEAARAAEAEENYDAFDPLFVRDLLNLGQYANFPNMTAHTETITSALNRSARFSTTVNRSSGPANAANTPLNPNPNQPARARPSQADIVRAPVRLMEWAENILRLDATPGNDDDDDDEPMPPLEAVPRDDDQMPELEPISDSDDEDAMPALEPIPRPQPISPPSAISAPAPAPALGLSNIIIPSGQQPYPQHRHRVADNQIVGAPPIATSGSSVQPSNPPTPAVRLPPSAATTESTPARPAVDENVFGTSRKKTSAQQDFTTDGRGRVINIGVPEPPAPVVIPYVAAVEEEGPEHLPAPEAVQRKTSEFTTDGRGRVISVGGSPSGGPSDAAEGSPAVGEGGAHLAEDDEGESEEGGNGRRGLFSWINGLF